jgi:hypothetical protein
MQLDIKKRRSFFTLFLLLVMRGVRSLQSFREYREVEISYKVSRGLGSGTVLHPHRHDDGMYVASKTRFERDYIRVATVGELLILIGNGFSIRMSCPGSKTHAAPSLISPSSISVAVPVDSGSV